ncbi:U32 family peptidase [Candidatus Pacearchaeota archaeon]|nr:U32 family peptidase [Candidatus Pacearchaeota archaeon]
MVEKIKKKIKKLELLSPAGDFECLNSAIESGADAIYFGLQDFNMRGRAKNFKISDLEKIKKICDKKGIKKYLTLNTLIYDNELEGIEKLIKKVCGYVDAVICSDISIMLLCKKYKIPFFVSTQVSVSNVESAKFFKKLGCSRIVLARELSLNQIKKISKVVDIEIFIHGAMCVSESGRCFTSQFLFNESANRGKCIQPCRRKYNVFDDKGNSLKVDNNFIFSAKDLCTLPFFEKIKSSGAVSFKIEGRNKDPVYVSTVTRVYKEALDDKLSEERIKELIEELSYVYNKGFSSGFYKGYPTRDDFSKIENSSATEKKLFLGKIEHYYDKLGVGLLKLNTGSLKIGDFVYIIGKTTSVKRLKIESMEIENKSVNEVKKGMSVGIKLPNVRVRKNDSVYKIVKKKG